MDSQAFDQFTRRLSGAITRRTALAASLAALVPAALPEGEAGARGAKCPPCKRRVGPKGRKRCRPVPDNRACQGNGRCLSGKCRKPPTCKSSLQDCSSAAECCSSLCLSDPGFCGNGPVGSPCHVDFDCGGGPSNNFRYRCIGFVCRDMLA